jgi:hypothetical protein
VTDADQARAEPATQPGAQRPSLDVAGVGLTLVSEVVPDTQQLVYAPIPWFL